MTIFENKVLLVVGGASEIGEGIVRTLLMKGAHVIVPCQEKNELKKLSERLGNLYPKRLITIWENISTDNGMDCIKNKISDTFGRLNGLIDCIIPTSNNCRITELKVVDWEKLVENYLTSRLVIAQSIIPLLQVQAGSAFIQINGCEAEQIVTGSGAISMLSAALVRLKDVLLTEDCTNNVRYFVVNVGSPIVTRSRLNGKDEWFTSDEIGKFVAFLLSPEGNKYKGRTIKLKDKAQIIKT